MSDLATDLGPEMEKSNLAMNISKSFITTDKTPDVQVWTRSPFGKCSSEGAAREWSTVVIVIVIFIS